MYSYVLLFLLTHGPGQNGWQFADEIFKNFFLNEIFVLRFGIFSLWVMAIRQHCITLIIDDPIHSQK